jgi:hypothetical protein
MFEKAYHLAHEVLSSHDRGEDLGELTKQATALSAKFYLAVKNDQEGMGMGRASRSLKSRPISSRDSARCFFSPCTGASSASPFVIRPRLAAQRTTGRKHAAARNADVLERQPSINNCNSAVRTSNAGRGSWSTNTRSIRARADALDRNTAPGPRRFDSVRLHQAISIGYRQTANWMVVAAYARRSVSAR